MAKGRIENSDLFAPDLGKETIKTFQELNRVLNVAEDQFKDMLEASVDVTKQIPQTNKQIQEFNKSIQNSQKAVIGLEKVEQQRIKTKQQEELLNQKVTKTIEAEIKAEKELSKAIQEEEKVKQQKNKTSKSAVALIEQERKLIIQQAKETERLSNIQKRTVKQRENDAKKLIRVEEKAVKQKQKEATAQAKLNSKYEQAKIQLNKLAKELKEVAFVEGKNAKSTKRLAKEYDVLRTKVFKAEKVAGEFQRNVGNYPKALGKATNALRSMGLAFGGLAIIRNVFNTVKDFEQSIANLSAITGATGDDLDFLKGKAIELGSSTTLSANQVAEGFKLIASAKPELLGNAEALTQVTESAITLAEAAGIELPEAASALANSLNQFGEGAESAAKFVDTLAAGSKFGAGDINFLNEALVSSGTVAKDAGLGIQETVAALELFAEKGIPASKAGNSFKNVLLNLQKSGKGFVDGKFNLQAAIGQVNKELNDIKDPSERAAASINLFGKENITTGKILLQNNGRLAEMTDKVDENGIALEQQAINNDTLQGAIKAVSSAWEGFILNLEEGTGAFGILKDILFFVAENLGSIFKVVGIAAAAFVSFKVAVVATNVVMKSYTAIQTAMAVAQAAATTGTKAMTFAQKAAIVTQKALNLVMKLNPIGLIITLIASLVTAYVLFVDQTTLAEKAQESFNEGLKSGEEAAIKYVKELKKVGDEQRRLIDLREKAGEISSDEADKLRLQSLKDESVELKKQYNDIDDLRDAEQEASEQRIQNLKDQQSATEGLLDVATKFGLVHSGQETLDDQIEAEVRASKVVQGEIQARIDQIGKAIDANKLLVEESNADIVGTEKEHQDEITKIQKAAREKRAKELDLYRIRLEDLQDEAIVSSFKRETAQINRKFDRDIAAIKGNSQVEIDLRLALEQSKQTSLDELRIKFQDKEDADRKADSDKKIAEKKKQNSEALELDIEYFDKIADEQTKALEIRAVNDEVAATEFLVIELDRLEAELELLKIYGEDTVDIEKAILDKRHAIKLANLEEAKASNEELIELQAELSDAQAQALSEDLAKLDKALTAINDILKERSDERIAFLDKELAANKLHQTELQELANQGVVNAADNLAFEKKRQADLELQKKREIEKAAKQELALTAIKTYSGYVQQGQSGVKALASTVTDIELLKAFITGLDLFYEGTEDTGTSANPLDSNGGRLAVLHDNERVMSAKQNKLVSHLSNDELASIGSNYKAGEENVNKAMQIQRFESNGSVLAKFDQLENAIGEIDIPNVEFHYDSIRDSFVKTIETKNKIERIHHKKSPLW